MTDEKEKKAQEMYMEFQALDQHIKQLQSQFEAVTQQLMELSATVNALEDVKNISKGREIFVPVSPGIFAKASIEDTSELFVNVGSNVVVQKNVESAKKLIARQIDGMRKIQKQMADNIEKMANRAAHLEAELQKIVSTQ